MKTKGRESNFYASTAHYGMRFSVPFVLLSELLEKVCQELSQRKPINADANLAEVAVLGSKWFSYIEG